MCFYVADKDGQILRENQVFFSKKIIPLLWEHRPYLMGKILLEKNSKGIFGRGVTREDIPPFLSFSIGGMEENNKIEINEVSLTYFPKSFFTEVFISS